MKIVLGCDHGGYLYKIYVFSSNGKIKKILEPIFPLNVLWNKAFAKEKVKLISASPNYSMGRFVNIIEAPLVSVLYYHFIIHIFLYPVLNLIILIY